MSTADDDKFAKEVVETCAKIIGKENAKLKKELQAEKTAREAVEAQVVRLSNHVEGLERRVMAAETTLAAVPQQHACEDVLQRALSAALIAVATSAPPAPGPEVVVRTEAVAAPMVVDDGQQPGSSGAEKRPAATESSTLLMKKSKRPGPQERPKLCMTLEEVPNTLRELIAPFYDKNPCASHDYLSDVQRAYVKFKANQHIASGERLTSTVVQAIITEGVMNNIWFADFKPSEEKNFHDYMFGRLRNEKKARGRKSLLGTTESLVQQYMDTEMQILD